MNLQALNDQLQQIWNTLNRLEGRAGPIELQDTLTVPELIVGERELVVGEGNETTFKGDLHPALDNTFYLGSADLRWCDIQAVTKTSILEREGGERTLVSVLEGPGYMLYDANTDVIEAGGTTRVDLDPLFTELCSPPFRVFTSGVEVTAKDATGFEVRGPTGKEFDWLVLGVRAGFENVRFRNPVAKPPRGLRDPKNAVADKDPLNNTPFEKPHKGKPHGKV